MGLLRQIWQSVKYLKRVGGVRGAAQLAKDAPKYVQLYRRLFLDSRVPKSAKLVLAGAGAFAVSPLNLPNWIPFIGLLDDLAIVMLANSYFIKKIPATLLAEHRAAVGLGL